MEDTISEVIKTMGGEEFSIDDIVDLTKTPKELVTKVIEAMCEEGTIADFGGSYSILS